MDPSGRFTGDTNVIRTGACSSVDLLNMFVDLGNKGDTTWLTQYPNNLIYTNRHDMYSMLKSRFAPGRDYLLFATDEIAPGFFNFNGAPNNILSLTTSDTKVGVYSDWLPLSHPNRPHQRAARVLRLRHPKARPARTHQPPQRPPRHAGLQRVRQQLSSQ